MGGDFIEYAKMTKKQKRIQSEYNREKEKETKEQIRLVLPIGYKQTLKEAAGNRSVLSYIKEAIDTKLLSDGFGVPGIDQTEKSDPVDPSGSDPEKMARGNFS